MRHSTNDPAAVLDDRYSDPDARPAAWADVRTLLEDADLAWISTVRVDGRPHVTPLVTVWYEGALCFCTGSEEQKARNLEHDAHVAITTGCSTWASGTDVVVEGMARRVVGRDRLDALAAAWRTRWDGRWRFEVGDEGFRHELGGTVPVFEVRPTKVLAFGKGDFAVTRFEW